MLARGDVPLAAPFQAGQSGERRQYRQPGPARRYARAGIDYHTAGLSTRYSQSLLSCMVTMRRSSQAGLKGRMAQSAAPPSFLHHPPFVLFDTSHSSQHYGAGRSPALCLMVSSLPARAGEVMRYRPAAAPGFPTVLIARVRWQWAIIHITVPYWYRPHTARLRLTAPAH